MRQIRKEVAGILLAAGSSTRMKRPKQLLQVGEETLLGRILKETLDSDLDKVVLVLGHKAKEIRRGLDRLLDHPRLRVAENRHYRKGISSSIIAGLSEIEDSHDHAMVLLADMPRIDTRLINILLQKYLASGLPLGAVRIKNRRSHPVIFSRKIYPELRRLQGDRGARELFQKFRDKVMLVEPEGSYDDRDIDTLEDYVRFRESLEAD